MAVIEIAKIQVRRGQELQTGVPQLDPGELGWAQDTEHLYIGKRISEGASTDENSRILTDRDLENIFNLVGSTVTQAIVYQYRENVAHINATNRTLQSKLDDFVSITDYGVIPSSTATDITANLVSAIDNIFKNSTELSFQRRDSRRKLLIPAGNYYINQAVELPPYTVLQGEGQGLTTLTLINSSTYMFKTIDAVNNDFESTAMESGVNRAREVELSNMTLEYAVTASSNYALLSLDNVLNARVENVEFRISIDPTSTTTYGLSSLGKGISIRGTGGGIGSGDSNLCENIAIENCRFDSLLIGVEGTGSIVRTVIGNSVFNNLNQGVKMHTVSTLPGPSNGYLRDNRFQNIVNEAIFIGTSSERTNFVSENNLFVQVGNGTGLDDTVTSAFSPVLRFYSSGNKSFNDYFQRQAVANSTTTSASFYYNPLLSGEGVILDSTGFKKILPAGTTTEVVKLYLNGVDQKIDLDYKMYTGTGDYLRTGQLLVNIAGSDDYGNISDYYNYNYNDSTWSYGDPDSAVFSCSTATNNYIRLDFDPSAWTTATEFTIEYTISRSA
jgi:hypothetical protein